MTQSIFVHLVQDFLDTARIINQTTIIIIFYCCCVFVVIKPHRLHAVHRCDLLQQMSHARTAVGVSVCVDHTHVLCKKKRLNRSRCRLGSWLMSVQEPCIRWGQDRTNPFAAARGDKSAMRPFARLLWTLAILNAVVQDDIWVINCRLVEQNCV